MRTYTKEKLEASRPDEGDRHCVEYCLTRLYADKQHSVDDKIHAGFTFEELIGALLLARDALDERDMLKKENETLTDLLLRAQEEVVVDTPLHKEIEDFRTKDWR